MRTIRRIIVNADKCTGCRQCENICSAYHSDPKYNGVNSRRSRIKVVGFGLFPEEKGYFLPVFGGPYIEAECSGRNVYVIEGKEYSECAFCPSSCPSRGSFKEPDSGLPLKCDLCLEDPPLPEPMCVKWCVRDALVYTEYEVEDEVEEAGKEEQEIALEYLVQRYGLKEVVDTVRRMLESKTATRKIN